MFEDLLLFLKQSRNLKGAAIQQADDAKRLTFDEVIAWRDAKLEQLLPKTVKDTYVASLKAVLARAVEDRKLPENVAAKAKVRASSSPVTREKGFNDEEAIAILRVCKNYRPPVRDNPANNESAHITAAKRWGPWLCAFTGARAGEILQMRKSDIREVSGVFVLHITSDAGTVKAREFRDVPMHRQLVELGFLEFVKQSLDGPLFYSHDADPNNLPAQAVYDRVAKWLHSLHLIPAKVSPNHGWRHRFKTLSMDADLNPRVVDAIQGHSGRTASDGYGNVSLKAKKLAIDKLEDYPI